ncbi:hypothetical protein L1887_01061 [Cichorium endivia]|nr:hypothetical protein L1887_01061 [Cichorium endivia]
MQHPKTRGRSTGTTGKLKTTGANRDNVSSQSSATNRTPRSTPASEKKRVGRVSELENQVAQLQEELKKTKDHLSESESCQKRAQREAEDAKKQLAAALAKLEESQQQLDEIYASEESRIQELRKISQDRDRAWESELKAVQKHHEMDSAVLAATMNENQKLKIQLQKAAESEAAKDKYAESAHDEVHTLRLELSETLVLVAELKARLNESKDSEAQALELVSQTREQLEMVESSMEKDVVQLIEDTDGNDEVARVVELGSALAANAEMESELRKLKVQTEQWRKAAEMAAAMVLGDGGSGKFVEQSESFIFHALGQKSNSSYSEDMEDESSNKKSNNMLKKIGVLLKKGQKQFETSSK